MKIITIEEHFDTAAAAELFNRHVESEMRNSPFHHGKLIDFEERLHYMDANGIDMQVLSDAGNSPQYLPGKLAVTACRDINDVLASVVTTYPDRFAGFATLPVDEPSAAAEELSRSVSELGLKGALISGTMNGQFMDNSRFLPIFAEAEKLDVPLYLHPGYPTKEEVDMFYMSEAYPKMLGSLLSTLGWGWHMVQGIQMVRLICAGIFDRFPNLKLISGHWGEFVPTFLERLDLLSAMPGTDLTRPLSDYYRNNVYVTPSGMFTKPQFDLAFAEMGADHILYSEDYPFMMRGEQVRSFFDDMQISPEDKEKIAHLNTEKLLKL